MRNNEPVTQSEYALHSNAVLMSTTDLDSHTHYANAAFIEASGFSLEELQGQPHNGEAGKGFAAVASEVRTLSEGSTQAAAEIRELIKESSGEVSEGARLASNAGKTMSDLNHQIAELSTLVNGISVAVVEQSAGIGGINTEVHNLDSVTSGNSKLVKRATESVDQLHVCTQLLSDAVALYTSQ